MNDGYELGMLLRQAYLLFHRRANGWLHQHGVTADQFVVLTVIGQQPGSTQVTIADRTASDPNSITVALRLLEQRGLIRREVHASDGRARCVFLTAEGRRMQRRAARESAAIVDTLWSCLPASDRGRVEKFLEKVQQTFANPIEKADGQPPKREAQRKAK